MYPINFSPVSRLNKQGLTGQVTALILWLLIIELKLEDKLRKKALERNKNVTPKKIGSTKDLANKKKTN